MKRGDVITVAVQGDFGKPRLAVVIQSDTLAETETVLVCLLTTTCRDAPLYRVDIPPGNTNGLRQPSQVMAGKIFAIRRRKCGLPIGRIAAIDLAALDRILPIVLGLGSGHTSGQYPAANEGGAA